MAEQFASWIRFGLDDPEEVRRLYSATRTLREAPRLGPLAEQVLDGALRLGGADRGNVQVLDRSTRALRIVSQHGFSEEFLDYFAVVDDDGSACGRAAKDRSQTVIVDVDADPRFEPHREIAASSGFRAVQSTPLISDAGRLVGVVSTHYRRPHRPGDRDLKIMQRFGVLAGTVIAQHLEEFTSPRAEEQLRTIKVRDAKLARVLMDFASLLVREYEVGDALQDLVDGVADTLRLTGAGVWVVEGGRTEGPTATATSKTPASTAAVIELERAQQAAQAGPCIEAYHAGHAVLVEDLRDERRWPVLSRLARDLGMGASAGIPLHADGKRLGALSLYHESRREWDEDDVRVAMLLADVAAAHMENASRLGKLRRTSEQLEMALESRVVLEQAKGILASYRDISVEEAFELIRGRARSRRTSVREVAEGIIDLGLRI